MAAPREIELQVRLIGGHDHTLTLREDAPELLALFTVLASPEPGEDLMQLPLEGGRAACSFRASQLVSIISRPPVVVDAAPAPQVGAGGDVGEWRATGVVDALARDLERWVYRSGNGAGASDVRRSPAAVQMRARAERQVARHRAYEGQRQEALRRLCADVPPGPLVVMSFNEGHGVLFENWAASCRAHGIEPRARTVVFPTDAAAHDRARRLGFRCYYDVASYDDLPTESGRYGDAAFRAFMFAKCAVVHDVLQLDRAVLFQDVDLVWRRDPVPDLRDRAVREGLDYQFMYDGRNPHYAPLHLNSGFFYVSNTARARFVWSTILEQVDKVLWSGSQQHVVNLIMHFFLAKGLRLARLPERQYLNGHLVRAASSGERSDGAVTAADVVHVSWTKNLSAKLEKLRDNGLWFLDD